MNASLFGVRKKVLPFEAEKSPPCPAFIRDGVFKNLVIGVERVQFVFDTLLENQIVERNFFLLLREPARHRQPKRRARQDRRKNPSRYFRCSSLSGSPLMCWTGISILLLSIHVA